MARYRIALPSNEAVEVDADKVRQGPDGALLVFGASGNPNGKPDVIPQGEWRSYGIPFVASKRANAPASGKPFSVRADTRNKRKEATVTKRRKPRRNSLVSDLMAFINSYVVMSEAQTLVVALWVIHTHCFEAFQQTPYMVVTSPDPRCGKSRLLEVVHLLVHEPWEQIIPSEAVLYRKIHLSRPTALLDEIDTIFKPSVADRYEGHRALLNAGHRRGARVSRCVGSSGDLEEFRVFCPKMIAGIGTVPDTVADRGVSIRLARKRTDEKVERFRSYEVQPLADPLRERIGAWAEKHGEELGLVHPDMPAELNDRMQDGCEPLVAIADKLGYGPQARAALVELLTKERLDSHETMRLRLLRDIKAIFEAETKKKGKRVDRMSTQRLLERLHAMRESGWGNYYGRAIEARDLADLLGHYGIKPTTVFLGKKAGKDLRAKGYKRDDLADPWERYL